MELPAQFSERINKISDLLDEYSASISDDEKMEKLRLALVTSCELLRSINMEVLRSDIKKKFLEAHEAEPKWRDIIIGSNNHFEFFLTQIEDKLLKHIGIHDHARERIRKNLHNARLLAPSMQPDMIVRSIKYLRDDVCLEARIKVLIAKDNADAKARKEWYFDASKKCVKAIAAGVIVVNVTGLAVSMGISAPGSAASVALGGAAQFV